MLIGYCRVSTSGQSLESQLQKLSECEKIYKDKASAKSADRPELKKALDFVRGGDVLVITKLDRLARSLKDLCEITSLLEKKGVALKVLDQQIDTSSPAGKLMFHMIGAIAEFERSLINERTREGQQLAKYKGVKFGRKQVLTEEQIESLLEDCRIMRKTDVAEKYGVSRAYVYNLTKGREDTSPLQVIPESLEPQVIEDLEHSSVQEVAMKHSLLIDSVQTLRERTK